MNGVIEGADRIAAPLADRPARRNAPQSPDQPRDPPPLQSPAALREAAAAFESVFLAEMLRHAGLGESRRSMGGGVGEDAFADMLAREWAKDLAASGGIGLAERVVAAFATGGAAGGAPDGAAGGASGGGDV